MKKLKQELKEGDAMEVDAPGERTRRKEAVLLVLHCVVSEITFEATE